jgi:hypothetical protein
LVQGVPDLDQWKACVIPIVWMGHFVAIKMEAMSKIALALRWLLY